MKAGAHYIVAGASRGIGAACAALIRKHGGIVTALSRSDGVDLTDPAATEAAINAAYDRHGPISGLVCTAGAAQQAPLGQLSTASLRAGMEAKYFTYVNAMLPCLALMAKHQHGVIVPVIGMGGKVVTKTHLPGGAANAALMLLTTGLGHAYAGQGIRVVGINPGFVETDRFTHAIRVRAQSDGIRPQDALAQMAAAQPSGKIMQPDDIAQLACFLLSDASRALNGTVIAADAGASPVL